MTGKVLVENVDNCYFDKTLEFFISIKDKKATWYSVDGREMAVIDNVKTIDADEGIIKTEDGNIIVYTYYANGGKRELEFSDQKDTIPAMPFKYQEYGQSKTDYRFFVLDANNVLWSKPYEEDDKSFEKVAENVTQLFGHLRIYYIKDNILYNGLDEKIIEGVKGVNPFYLGELMLYIKTDGALYEGDYRGTIENKILSDVKYVYTDPSSYTFAYIVREDGSVWKYDTMRQSNAVAKQIKAGREIGDIDGDGEIAVRDILPILQSLSGSQEMKPEEVKKADIDGDGKVTVKDVLRALHFVSGQSSAL